MDFPLTTILIITYKRLPELTRTIDALMKHIQYPKDRLQWVIADDSSGEDYVEQIKAVKRFQHLNLRFIVTPQNSGWAGNVNNALRQISTPYIFFIEDDYELIERLDLCAGAALMETRRNIGMLRYRGIAGSHVVTHLFESDISDFIPDYQEGVGLPGKLSYLQLDSGSPELYLYSHGCHLRRHPDFMQFYGAYPEGLRLGHTEESYAHMVKDGMKQWGAPALAIQPHWVVMRFNHIGQSYQFTEHDKEHKVIAE